MSYSAERYHDISAGHRVVGHESKCRHLHGHNYRIHFVCEPKANETYDLDQIGRVIDFGVIKSKLCMWVEKHWDHKFLIWKEDPMFKVMRDNLPHGEMGSLATVSFVPVPFNPTAENMAAYLVNMVGPEQLKGTGVVLETVRIEETRKCSATYTRPA